MHSLSSPSSPVQLLSGVLLPAPTQVGVLNRSLRDQLSEAGRAQLNSGYGAGPQRARVVLWGGGPFPQNTGIAGVVQGIRLLVYAGQALIAANHDWDAEAQAHTIQRLGVARSDAGESAPVRYPLLVEGRAPGIALSGGIDLDRSGFSPP